MLEGVGQWICPLGSSITIVQIGGGELVELHVFSSGSLSTLCVVHPMLVLAPTPFVVSSSPPSFKSMSISELELHTLSRGRGIEYEALNKLWLDSEFDVFVVTALSFVSMSFQWTAFPGFLGVPELMVRVGLRDGWHFLRWELISRSIPSVNLLSLSWSTRSSWDNCVYNVKQYYSSRMVLM